MTDKKQPTRRKFFKASGIIAGSLVLSKLSFSKGMVAGLSLPISLPDVFIVPNMHPASCGWLDNFSVERNYCANNYFAHMDRVQKDSSYNFVISEVNNMIAMDNFLPDRFNELKREIQSKRIEAVNGMFLELTPNLSGGEAIVRMGIHGIQWQREVLGADPQFNWMIDITGLHEQLAQISAGLGLKAMVHCRMNISGSPVYFSQSPDGTKLLTISPGHYASWPIVFDSLDSLQKSEIEKLGLEVNNKDVLGEMPYLVLGGSGDYSLPPKNSQYPKDLIKAWKSNFPSDTLHFSTLSAYVQAIKPLLNAGKIAIPVIQKGWGYSWDAFWVENPKVKTLYRENEYRLQSAEMLATIASLKEDYSYPAQNLYHAWLQLHLNTDRNTLWGAAGGMVFEDPQSWDVHDRFNWITNQANEIRETILKKKEGKYLSWFNPLNWIQSGPQYIDQPAGKKIKGYASQKVDQQILFFPHLPSLGTGSLEWEEGKDQDPHPSSLPSLIKNDFFTFELDPNTGILNNLKLTNSKKEVITEGIILRAERAKNNNPIYHELPRQNERREVASIKGTTATISYTKGNLAQIIKISSSLFKPMDFQQIITVYDHYPRIDFDMTLTDLPDKTITFLDFLSNFGIIHESRGIPYGFTSESASALLLRQEGVHPVIGWSSYSLRNGTGFALLDRGIPGREISANTVSLMLNATSDEYMGLPGGWLSGKGKQRYQFALLPYEKENLKEIQQMAWQYNYPALFESSSMKRMEYSFLSTSDNIIVEAIYRVKDEIVIRFVECKGMASTAKMNINFPVETVRLTNFLGEGNETLSNQNPLIIPVKPQQITTLHCKIKTSVDPVEVLRDWSPLVPKNKRKALHQYDRTLIGHPPH